MTESNPFEPPQAQEPTIDAQVVCPSCGVPCENGVIRSLGSVNWYPEKMASFKMVSPQRLSSRGLSLESRIPAIKCPNCNMVMVYLPEN